MNKDFKILNNDEINFILAKRIKQFREQDGFTLREVASKINKSPSQVSLWERGVNPPSCIDLFKLCLIYDIALPDLFPEIYEEKKLSKQELELIKKYRSADKDIKSTIQKILEYTQEKKGWLDQSLNNKYFIFKVR